MSTVDLDNNFVDYNVTTNANSVTVVSNYAGASELGLTGNVASTYASVKTVISADLEIFNAMKTMSAVQIEAAIKTMAPQTSGGSVGAISASSGAVSTVSSHMKVARAKSAVSGIATGDIMSNMNVWGQAYYSDSNQDAMNGVEGYDALSSGMVFGIDKQIDSDTLYGLAFSFGSTDVNSKDMISLGQTHVDSKQLSAYFSKKFDTYYMDGVFSYGINKNTGSRNIVVNEHIQRTALSEYNSQILSAKIGASTSYKYNGFTVSPNMSLSYATVATDTFSEAGAGSLNLTVVNQDTAKATAVAGFTLSKAIKTDSGGTFIPEFKFSLKQEFGDAYSTSHATFSGAGDSFITEGLEADDSAMTYGLGSNYTTSDKMTEIRFGLDQTKANGFTSDAATVTVRFKF
jgi:outer membrane autotransporter protein